MSRFGTLWINSKEYDLDDIAMDDMAEVQYLCPRKAHKKLDGETIEYEEPTPWAELNFGDAKVQIGMAYVILRREDPAFTLEQAGQLKLIAFQQPDEEVPDTGPPVEGVVRSLSSSDHAGSGAPDSDTQSLGSVPGTSVA